MILGMLLYSHIMCDAKKTYSEETLTWKPGAEFSQVACYVVLLAVRDLLRFDEHQQRVVHLLQFCLLLLGSGFALFFNGLPLVINGLLKRFNGLILAINGLLQRSNCFTLDLICLL